MSYRATVFNVVIASPGDVEPERAATRVVIHEWNAIHSPSQQIVLMPVGWETHSHPSMGGRAQAILNEQIVDGADLLIALFWARLGTPTGDAQSGTVEEVERHLQAGRPAMVYFSSTPVALESVDLEQYKALQKFKASMRERGLVEEYSSREEFREKITRQLAAMIIEDPYFKAHQQDTFVDEGTLPEPTPHLTNEAEVLLREATSDPNGQILHMHFLGGEQIVVNKKQFVESGDPRSQALWLGALDELENLGYVHDAGGKRQVFRVTREGYSAADSIAGST